MTDTRKLTVNQLLDDNESKAHLDEIKSALSNGGITDVTLIYINPDTGVVRCVSTRDLTALYGILYLVSEHVHDTWTNSDDIGDVEED